VARQPAASSNNHISSIKKTSIGNMIGNQLTSTFRIRKQSTTSFVNRNKSIIDSVKSPERTPPSNVAKQPTVSSNNRISSIDRADSRIGSVISPKRTPPPNAAKRPAASLNRDRSSNIKIDVGSSVNKHANLKSRTKKQLKINQDIRDSSRIGDTIREKRPSTSVTGAHNRETVAGSRIIKGTNSGRTNRKANPEKQTTIINEPKVNTRGWMTGSRKHHFNTTRPSHLIYRDRPHSGRNRYQYEHTYVDYYSRLRRKIIWPKYRFMLCYNRGPWFSFRYFYPYYHRKYLFVSLGGYWPLEYNYIRYYWYGCHPYYWYGYYPIAREVQGDTYNYYTYNYYYGDQDRSYEPSEVVDSIYYKNLSQQPAEEPAQATLADSYFEEAVEAFEASNYSIAVDKFAKAMEFAPNDMVLPFAYCQALLAAEHYSKAAEVLRAALTEISPEKEGVFYPRGLYSDEEILLDQLDKLAEKVEIFNFDADLQLLLGYQLLGIGQVDKAITPLMNAGRDLKNADAAAVLLKLLEKVKTSEDEAEETEEAETEGAKIQDTGTGQSSDQSKIINKEHATRTKGTVLLATVCILAGSTGIGHYFRI
jgi:hypothetical protein